MRERAFHLCRIACLALLGAALASCNTGGGGGLPALRVVDFNFSPGFAGVHLNSPLVLTFSAPVDPATVTPDTVRIFTTTVTKEQPDAGAPAVGEYVIKGNVVTFLPRIPQNADLSDSGLRLGFTYAIQVPAAPDVISPVRTIEGRPNVVSFDESFSTLNQTILPAPDNVTAEPNLGSLPKFFVDEGIENGTDPCDRQMLPVADRNSPQVIFSDPAEGEAGFGTITGIQPGLGTAFVRLDTITVKFSEPIAPWRIRPQNISIRNTNLGGKTFDLFFFFRQDRQVSILQITVFDAQSAFDQASVPQGRYVLSFTDFSDLAGNPLVNSNTCTADGTYQLSFSTVSSPALPTDIKMTFQDDDQDGHTDVGGLGTPTHDPNVFPEFTAPFLGGIAINQPGITVPSPSLVTTSANPGNTGMWTGREMRYDNGYNPLDPNANTVPDAVRLRGASSTAATAILAPIAGSAIGPSNQTQGTTDGEVPSTVAGKFDFDLEGSGTVSLFTGDLSTGPILYHYHDFKLEETAGGRPLLTYKSGSIYPMVILVENSANVWGDINVDGQPGAFGYNGLADGTSLSRTPGGAGGAGGPGGGAGGDGGAHVLNGGTAAALNGATGGVPANVLGPLDQLSESVAGLANMAPGGGGNYDATQAEDHTTTPPTIPAYTGGGGGGIGASGGQGADFSMISPGGSDHGVGGKEYGNQTFIDPGVLATGGAGGGGGAADDDTANIDTGARASTDPDGVANSVDNGGGGGGGGGGFFGLSCAGDVNLGYYDDMGTADPSDDVKMLCHIRACGARGGSTYATVSGTPPVPASPDADVGTGEGGGGGAGGGICIVSGGSLAFNYLTVLARGKQGGNDPNIEGGNRTYTDPNTGQPVSRVAGAGGSGLMYFADSDGIDVTTEILNNPHFSADPSGESDGNEFSAPVPFVNTGTYGNDPREALFGKTQIVSEFFDTLSPNTSYDEVRVLSNAPRYPYSVGTADQRTIRVFLDVTNPTAGDVPDLSTEDTAGNLVLPVGYTQEIGLHYDETTGAELMQPQYDSRYIIPAGGPSLGKRFARVRIVFDLSLVGTPAQLLDSFAPPGAPEVPVADDPATPGLDNTLGNLDTAPQGVPAVAEVRVRFTPS